MDHYESMNSQSQFHQDLQGFSFFVLLAQLSGVTSVLLVVIWMGNMYGGFSLEEKLFNYHPLLMIMGLVFVYGESILAYRVFRHNRKVSIKILHAILHLLAFVLAVLGVGAVYISHRRANRPNFYSFHSHCGLVAIGLFIPQWLIGFLSFLYPKFGDAVRATVLKVHVVIGKLIFGVSVATALMGITEMLAGLKDPSIFHQTRMTGHSLGLMIVIFAAIVFYVVNKHEYRRVEPPEDTKMVRS